MLVHEGVVWHVCLPVHSHGEQTTNLLGYKAFHAVILEFIPSSYTARSAILNFCFQKYPRIYKFEVYDEGTLIDRSLQTSLFIRAQCYNKYLPHHSCVQINSSSKNIFSIELGFAKCSTVTGLMQAFV